MPESLQVFLPFASGFVPVSLVVRPLSLPATEPVAATREPLAILRVERSFNFPKFPLLAFALNPPQRPEIGGGLLPFVPNMLQLR